MCIEEEEAPPPVVVEAPPPAVASTALAVVPGSPADESYDFFGDASRPESPARIAWEPPPRAPPKRVYMPKRRTRRPPVSRVPWSLLDELDAEKEKFAMQQVGDTFLTRLNLLDEPLADALLLRVGRLEAVLERRRPQNAFVAVAVGECIIVACMLLFAWRDFGGC